MSERQDGTSPDADHRRRGDDGRRMLAVTAERLATDADRAELSGYLAAIPADSEPRRVD